MNEPKLHHYVPRSVLRRFSQNDRLYVFDKQTGKNWSNSIGNTGAERHFYTVRLGEKKINFEYAFDGIDSSYFSILNKVLSLKTLAVLSHKEQEELCDVLAVQFLRTNTSRLTIKTQTEDIKKAAQSFGFEISPDNEDFHISKDEIKLATIKLIADRENIRECFLNKIPILISGERFITSDNPVTIYNPEKFGTSSISARGSMINFPITPTKSLSFYCRTTVNKLIYGYEKNKHVIPPNLIHLHSLVNAFKTGEVANLGNNEEKIQNYLQVKSSSRFIYSNSSDFSDVEKLIASDPSLARPYTLSNVLDGPPTLPNMPNGLWLIVHGREATHILEVSQWDEDSTFIDLSFHNSQELLAIKQDYPFSLAELVNDKKVIHSMRDIEIVALGPDSFYEFQVRFADHGLNQILEARSDRILVSKNK